MSVMNARRTLILALLLAACRAPEKPREVTFPNAPVILISIDTLRADHLPLYGYKGVQTPAIDALAKDSIVYERAYSPCPMTLPSHLTMLTGLLPTEHGVRNNVGFQFDPAKHPTIMQALRDRGYATGAAVSSYVLRGETGLRGAFDWYEDSVNAHAGGEFGDFQRPGTTTAALAKRWLDSAASRPFFLFLHLYEPHVPYAPPPEFAARYANKYDGEIAAADAIVGDVIADLKRRNLYDDALVVVTSDHGEGLGDHGEQQHSILLYTEAIHVPLLVKLPKRTRAGERITQPASLADITPTVAALVGATATAAPHSANLLALPATRNLYSESIYPYVQLGWSDVRSLMGERFHYIDSPRPELYDVVRDPAERQDVIATERRAAAAMRKELEGYPAATSAGPVDPEEAAKLAALGYIGTVRTRANPRSLPNPRDVIGVLDEIQLAFRAANEQQSAVAIAQMKRILQAQPRLVDVWVRLAEVYRDEGRHEEAISAYRQAIAVAGVVPADVITALGDVYLQSGNVTAAEQAGRAALSGSPRDARMLLARTALAQKDLATAERFAREAVGESGRSVASLLLLGEILTAKRALSEAQTIVDEAGSRVEQQQLGAVYGLEAARGELHAQADRPREAIAAYEREIARFPRNRIAYVRLAILHRVTGNDAGVEQTLTRMTRADKSRAAQELAQRTRVMLRQ